MIDKKQAKIDMRNTKESLGKQITELRKVRGLSLEKMCFECCIKFSYLEKLELGKLEISIGMLQHLARFFDKKIKIELVD